MQAEHRDRLLRFLQRASSIAWSELDDGGRLGDCNAGFLRLLPATMHPERNIRPYLISPSFEQMLRLPPNDATPVYSGLLTIGDRKGRTHGLTGEIWKSADSLLLLAEFDIEQLENIGMSAIRLSDEMSDLTRQLTTLNRELEIRGAQIRELSLTDQLTGIANRRKLDDVLEAELARIRRYGGDSVVIMMDIDRFKHVNDTYGHDVGDKALRTFASVLREETRDTDLPARYGGEEFVVCMPGSTTEMARECAERIRRATESTIFEAIPHPVTASFGVAALLPGDDAESVIKRADKALYRAKHGGRNRVVTAGEQ